MYLTIVFFILLAMNVQRLLNERKSFRQLVGNIKLLSKNCQHLYRERASMQKRKATSAKNQRNNQRIKEKMNTHHELLYAIQCVFFFLFNFVYAFSYITSMMSIALHRIASHRISSTPSNIGLSTSTLLNRIPLTLKSLLLFSSDSLFIHVLLPATLVVLPISFKDSVYSLDLLIYF